MIIKKINIKAFAGIVNKEIDFSTGFNLVYGENEKGKSTIEAFIKAMLYGLSTKKIKGQSERKKYMPFNESIINGEMIVEKEERRYIIKRSFGSTKKEDKAVVLDEITGEELKEIDSNEPGKYFLGINRSTFEKTLFINQLGVAIAKDKEEEIMDKITSLFDCGEEEVPVAKALDKLKLLKKSYVTSRGVGTLDILKKDYNKLIEERYEGYKLSEQNLQWEEDLNREKDKRKYLRDEISKLEIYKKYLKKVTLQKEYKEITEYLRKSEALKEEDNKIKKNIGKDFVKEEFIDSLKEDNIVYLSSLDNKSELIKEIEKLKEEIKIKEQQLEKYKFLDIFGDNLKEKLLSLKYEISALEDKINIMKRTEKDILEEKNKLAITEEEMEKLEYIKTNKEVIENTFKEYEDNLRELKYYIEKYGVEKDIEKSIKRERVNRNIGFLIIALGLIFCAFKGIFLYVAFVIIAVGLVVSYKEITILKELEIKLKDKKEIDRLSSTVESIEDKLKVFVDKFKVRDYGELLNLLKKYETLQTYIDRETLKISEKEKLFNREELLELEKKYKKNIEMIANLKRLSGSKDIDDILEKINNYNKLMSELEILEVESKNKEDALRRISFDIEDKENRLREKLNLLGLEEYNLLDIEVYIKDYREKLKKHNEIQRALESIEETYRVLLKDRNIEDIKEELKDIIADNKGYTYESEEEIEKEIKRKSEELIECEKRIKDLENSINNRFIGKRNLVEIEEDIDKYKDNIEKQEKELKALEMATEVMEKSLINVRAEIIPTINNDIIKNFKMLSGDRYEEIKLGDNYEMMVRDYNNIFKDTYLSNGAYDQLYLSLRLAFINLLFKNEVCPIILDDAFVQYDDIRREKALKLLSNGIEKQVILFSCQNIDKTLLDKNSIKYKYISLYN